MTDVLTERFAALADWRDDSDWLDVRRRVRRRRARLAAPVAAVAAAALAAAAVAGSGGWFFTSGAHAVTARTQVVVSGRTWDVSITRLCTRVSSAGRPTQSSGCGHARRFLGGPPFGARRFTVPGGQIWVGTPLGYIRRITITDLSGRVHSATTVRPPRGTKTPLRFWVITLEGTKAVSISALDGRGHTFHRRVR